MKKLLTGAAAAAVVALTAGPASAAVTLDFTAGGSVPGAYTVFQDFDGLTGGNPGDSLGIDAYVYDQSYSGIAAAPAFGSSGNFGAVLGTASSAAQFLLPTAAASFGFVLGSLDTYNTLTLIFESGPNLVLNGGDIIDGIAGVDFISGDQLQANSNGFLSVTSTGPKITGVVFSSTGNSFEFDNLAFGGVPEPSTWAMMILGIGFAGAAMRRRQQVQAKISFA